MHLPATAQQGPWQGSAATAWQPSPSPLLQQGRQPHRSSSPQHTWRQRQPCLQLRQLAPQRQQLQQPLLSGPVALLHSCHACCWRS